IIECKKDVNEFNKEKNKMLSNGGQLFTYYNFERSVKFLILYTYSFETSTFQNKIIEVKNEWKALNNQLEIFSHWNKNFIEKGLLEENALPYNIDKKPLKENDLISLNSDDSAKIFNQFAEILRHNVISDKPNAFNKLLNLFVCKIIDENKSSNSELDFQVLPTDTKYDLQNRLNDLYKAGMKEFLNLEIADTSYEEIEKLNASELDIDIVKKVKDIILDLRLKKNPEFSFIEVYDDKTFDENSVIIKEIVELLQPYRFRYNHKQQFLGNFFELLLNTSMKQEAGQFFTPIPIAKFIVNSIPVEEIIKNKISKDELHFLPYVIDYAAGSGHFLTEYMDKLQSIIQKLDIDGLKSVSYTHLRAHE
ncbi:restriction endonuclease subunit S, partial [Staphylococcus carnosus]|uniref:N-6 DNA methylase n=1 Tax=Staphylococcus carnosus TaxID=1281 RepID=UPI000CD39C42